MWFTSGSEDKVRPVVIIRPMIEDLLLHYNCHPTNTKLLLTSYPAQMDSVPVGFKHVTYRILSVVRLRAKTRCVLQL